MLDTVTENRLMDVLDAFHAEQSELERIARSVPLGAHEREQLGRDIARTSHAKARNIVDVIGQEAKAWQGAGELLHKHPLQKAILLKSDFIAQALKKPYGYAGDKDLMLMIYRNADRGSSVYAQLKNHVYQSLPAAEAVRERVRGMERILRKLPEGARVLCLACGPAWEVQKIAQDNHLTLQIDLLDHDRQTLNYTMSNLNHPGISHVLCNAFDIVKGQTSFEKLNHDKHASHFRDTFRLKPQTYDLIYSTGLYDYIASYPLNPNRGATGLTERLFAFVKPGGRLIVGNFLKPGESNLHQLSHQLMMEVYSDWKLLYRTPQDIQSFSSKLDRSTYRSELFDQTIQNALGPDSVIGFLALEKTQ